MKTCTRCGEEKPQSEFHKSFVTKAGEQRYFKYCKTCAAKKAKVYYQANIERLRIEGVRKQRERREARLDHETRRRRDLRKKYGITVEDWDRLHDLQLGRCAICHLPLAEVTKVCVDHDHVTGAVRGLLCTRCNQGLGYFQDSSEMLLSAARYIDSAPGLVGQEVMRT